MKKTPCIYIVHSFIVLQTQIHSFHISFLKSMCWMFSGFKFNVSRFRLFILSIVQFFLSIFCRCLHSIFAPILLWSDRKSAADPERSHISQPYLLCNPLQPGFLTYFSHIFSYFFHILNHICYATHWNADFLQYSILHNFAFLLELNLNSSFYLNALNWKFGARTNVWGEGRGLGVVTE